MLTEERKAMTVNLKSRLLRLLEENRETYISGGALAKDLAVSRNAIWKAATSLRAEGFGIRAVTNKGYRLDSDVDVLSEAGIEAFLKTEGLFTVETRKSVTSTNTVMREIATGGAREGYVIAAEEQTAGKGRLGRGFHSPAGHGVYFSLLLRPGDKASDPAGGTGCASFITSAAAVAVARAIEEVFGVRVGIKWVNDLYIGDKKVCGILTEATLDMENGSVDSAVLGIGINITKPKEGYPDEIGKIAASLTGEESCGDMKRCRLIASVLDNFMVFYDNLAGREFLDEYRERSIVLGSDIYVMPIGGGEARPASTLAIDDECRLVVRYEDSHVRPPALYA